MPFIWNDKIAKEIRVGDTKIYSIYAGNDLIWGTFKVIYHNLLGTNTEDEFVWGVGLNKIQSISKSTASEETLNKIKESLNGATDEITFECDTNWYTNPYCTAQFTGSIGSNTKKDVNLYCKWKAKSPMYRAVYSTSAWNYGFNASSIGDYPTSTGITTKDWQISHSKWYNWSSDFVGQCTWYVNGRTAQMHNGDASPEGTSFFPDATVWLKYCKNSWKAVTDSQAKVSVGDVVVWSTHVGVIEKINSDNTLYISQWNYGKTGGSAAPLTHWVRGTDEGSGQKFVGYAIYTGSGSVSTGTAVESDDDGSYIDVYTTGEWTFNKPTVSNAVSIETKYVYKYYNYATNSWSDEWI